MDFFHHSFHVYGNSSGKNCLFSPIYLFSQVILYITVGSYHYENPEWTLSLFCSLTCHRCGFGRPFQLVLTCPCHGFVVVYLNTFRFMEKLWRQYREFPDTVPSVSPAVDDLHDCYVCHNLGTSLGALLFTELRTLNFSGSPPQCPVAVPGSFITFNSCLLSLHWPVTVPHTFMF